MQKTAECLQIILVLHVCALNCFFFFDSEWIVGEGVIRRIKTYDVI